MGLQVFRVPTIEEIRQKRKKRRIVYMLTVFGDESHDEKKQRLFAVAGVMGNQKEWDALTLIWLKRTNGKAFHAADCEAGKGDFKGMPKEERLKLYKDLVKMLAGTRMMGFGAVMDLMAYDEIFPGTVANVPYHLCFQKVVMWFAQQAYCHVPQEKVSFTFDINSETNASCVVLYEAIVKTKLWKYTTQLVETISFTNRRESVGIQVADLLAREAMKHCDNLFIGSKKRVRESMKTLSTTGRYNFDFYYREYFENMKKRSQELEKKGTDNTKKYYQWLLQNKLNDNIFNRNKYLLDLVLMESAQIGWL